MSTTPNSSGPTAEPDRPGAGELSGAAATVWAVLNAQPGSTPAALASAAGIGRSTTTNALRHLEQTGLARRESATPDGNGRPASHWHPITAPDEEASSPPETQGEPSAEIDDAQEPPAKPNEHATSIIRTTSCSDASVSDDTNGCKEDQYKLDIEADSADEPAEADDLSTATSTHEPAEVDAKPPVAPEAIRPNSTITGGSKARLAPGALRDMVVNHLTAHRGEAFTATGISRVIEKSSGAIANALVTLTKRGITEQVTERPRTYRLATTPSSDDT
ncbi:MarR family transcriptional regulator [Streptomyces malaysiensis]|uniref:MarR family transcriptional regulator n=1 Tax=Streptomyces malaysiensis TaxID=92644 RepID=UPI0032203B01|nr:MarR family transcriptional regulator [Streptomyces malaysiensis]